MDRPSLEQDDIKAQFNSILSPYGILFPEHDILDSNIKESSPFALTFTIASNNEIQRQVSATSQPSVANTKNPDNSKGKDRPDARVPWKMVGMSGEPGLNGATSDPSLPDDKFDEHEKNPVGVYSVGETEFTEKSIKSIEKSEWDSSSRNPKDKKGFKSGFKLSQGWKKFRRSLRQTHSTGQEDKHNNGLITEGRKNNSLSTVDIQGHKALSEVDSPPEHDIEEAVGSKSIKSRFRSGSLREFLHKGSSSSSLIESENRDSKSIKGGAVVVSAESIMGQGKMHQYSKDNLIKQQKQSRQSSGKSPLSEPGNLESGYALPPDNSSSRTDNDSQPSVSAHEPAGFYNLPVEENPQDQQNNVVDDKEASNSSNIQSLAISDVDESKKSTEQEFYPPAQGMLQSPLSSRRWRLSMHRMSLVYGTICESKQEDNEHYLRQLMRNSTPDQDASQDAGTSEKPDHQDKAFKVPLSQSLQLASATFENGLRVPLSIYYVTEELRIREHNTQIEELFPEECDTKDVAFEELVEIFDKRPFGQDADLSIKTSVTSSNVEPENLVESAEGEHTTDDATTTECIQQTKPRSVTSRDLTRIVLRFLTDLPEPLITPDVFTTFSSMIQLQTIDSIKVQASSLLVQMLPMEQRQLLRFLLEFLDEVIFKPFKDDIQRLELNTPGDLADESIGYKHQQDLDLRNKEYKEQMLRISKAFGVACSQVGTSHGTANLSLARNKSQNSLYRHYKKEFELKAQQEKIAIAVRNSQEVFQFLMNYRVNIFGPSFISLFPSVSKERVEILSRFRNSVQRSDNDDQVEYNRDNIEKPILEQDRTNHKSLQFNRRLRNHLGPRRLAKLRFQDKMRLGAKGSRTLPVFKNRQSGTDLHNIHKMPSSSSFCDSGVEFSSVDLVALAAMKEHKARSMRIMKHIPCPSVATLHSIQVEMGSIIGVKEVDSNITPTSKSSGSRIMDTHDDVSSVMTGTSQRDIEELEYEKMQDISEDRRQDSKMCFKDFLEEPLDRKQQEREIRMVEKDILKSGMFI
ncbi:hypothetical protein BGZ46_003516 [Entomortierella lignicola]|nr:hypothetical protein BGZ46_003516 [Entomortierella lignicola]